MFLPWLNPTRSEFPRPKVKVGISIRLRSGQMNVLYLFSTSVKRIDF